MSMALMLNPALGLGGVAVAGAGAAGVGKEKKKPSSISTPLHGSSIRGRGRVVVAMADILGDFGARDPFPEEIESNFGEKTLGNVDTLHRILIPTLSVLSLSRVPLDPNPAALSHEDARKLLHKVVGWRLQQDTLECVWKVRDEACGQELIARINKALQGAAHAPTTLAFHPPNQVLAQLGSPSVGGLTVNDFIIAAKIDQVKTQDLIPKKRVWA
ncbi:probable pterin-4-alpha-carbinolamine dehydratase, chloroplastic [Brachypodium distachyon]|uniref:probable pterin-4-alpha-carbinolamine dehydratase, chloroplastic n=1 Tax=Brachypodium distachyon TaxID=15368 RepID=UPI0001C77091|nr:probable pterin-4-alpha-carbinolamine dehydratase, chloroplastic [Brachypodium distachyon]|eukprot:XP_003559052.1 probable pterin-4-alpha-carbinolamine dehydratase, chloroplastic [Brachypodium distachyon]